MTCARMHIERLGTGQKKREWHGAHKVLPLLATIEVGPQKQGHCRLAAYTFMLSMGSTIVSPLSKLKPLSEAQASSAFSMDCNLGDG